MPEPELSAWQLLGKEIRRYLFLVGEIFLTFAGVLLAYLIYQIWFTNQIAEIESSALASEIQKSFQAGLDPDTDSVAVEVERSGSQGFALLYIPALRSDVWGTPIVSGVEDRQLSLGVGHYPSTELPGEVGNFALAGHRATNGEPFARFENLKSGDLVYVQTSEGWFTYQLFQNQKISENEVWILDDLPMGVVTDSNQLITLTTCDPRWNSVRRWAWWGELIGVSDSAPIEVGSQ